MKMSGAPSSSLVRLSMSQNGQLLCSLGGEICLYWRTIKYIFNAFTGTKSILINIGERSEVCDDARYI
jgi:hypothetical protein